MFTCVCEGVPDAGFSSILVDRAFDLKNREIVHVSRYVVLQHTTSYQIFFFLWSCKSFRPGADGLELVQRLEAGGDVVEADRVEAQGDGAVEQLARVGGDEAHEQAPPSAASAAWAARRER